MLSSYPFQTQWSHTQSPKPSTPTISVISMSYFPNNYSKEQIQLCHFLNKKFSVFLNEKQIHINDSLRHCWRPSNIYLALTYHILPTDVDLLVSPSPAPQLLWKHLNSASCCLCCFLTDSDYSSFGAEWRSLRELWEWERSTGLLASVLARRHGWLWNPWHVASATEGLNLSFYLMVINLI